MENKTTDQVKKEKKKFKLHQNLKQVLEQATATCKGVHAKTKSLKEEQAIKTVKEKMQIIGRSPFDFYRNRDGEVMEILKVGGVSGARQLHPADLQVLIEQFAGGLRGLKKPLTFVILDFLVDYQQQIDYYRFKWNQTENQHRRYWLQTEINKLTYLQEHTTEEHYFVFIYGESCQEIMEQKAQLMRIKALNIGELSVTEKDALLYKLQNLNSIPSNQLRGETDAKKTKH